jgi:hypothetical protein
VLRPVAERAASDQEAGAEPVAMGRAVMARVRYGWRGR